ncbi:hypothetical protein HD554DRAFT_438897 [Boletus coccyginus]|nr:hypothetical protein HD554DRAFT_438897 [Boletus coccyginus]
MLRARRQRYTSLEDPRFLSLVLSAMLLHLTVAAFASPGTAYPALDGLLGVPLAMHCQHQGSLMRLSPQEKFPHPWFLDGLDTQVRDCRRFGRRLSVRHKWNQWAIPHRFKCRETEHELNHQGLDCINLVCALHVCSIFVRRTTFYSFPVYRAHNTYASALRRLVVAPMSLLKWST